MDKKTKLLFLLPAFGAFLLFGKIDRDYKDDIVPKKAYVNYFIFFSIVCVCMMLTFAAIIVPVCIRYPQIGETFLLFFILIVFGYLFNLPMFLRASKKWDEFYISNQNLNNNGENLNK